MAFSPDGKLLASAGWDAAIRLWEVDTGKLVRELSDPRREGTFAVAFAPDGKKLASVGERGKVRLWDVATGKKLSEAKGHVDGAYGVAFSPDGRTFTSAGDDVCVWDAATGAEVLRLQTGARAGRNSHGVAFSPNGKFLASGCGDRIHVWDLAARTEPLVIPTAQTGEVVSVAFAADGRTLLSGGYRYINEPGRPAARWAGQIHLWDATTGKSVGELKPVSAPSPSARTARPSPRAGTKP